MEEILDLVNEKDEIIGNVTRKETTGNPTLIHREISISIFNSKNQLLLAQRSLKKEVGPGYWTLSASGHVDQGEDPFVCAVREAKEELGIDVQPVFIDKYFDSNERESRFFYIYIALYDGDNFHINPDEVEGIKWVDMDKALEEITGSLGQLLIKKYGEKFKGELLKLT